MQPKPSSRIIIIDALRGFALLGILLAHICHSFAAGPLPTDVHTLGGKTADLNLASLGIYRISEFINAAFVNKKFYPLFTFIFGFSFFLQNNSFIRDNKNVCVQFYRRSAFLIVIGFIHNLFWIGDILMIYGILMIPLILARKFNDKVLLILGLVFVLNFPGILCGIWQIFAHERLETTDSSKAETFLHVISNGNLSDILYFDIKSLPGKLKFQALSGRLFMTLGFFFLGMLAARKNWISSFIAMKNKIYYVFIITCGAMIVFQLLSMSLNYTNMTNSPSEIMLGSFILSLQSLLAIIFYTSFLVILNYTDNIHKIFIPLANLGRTALTSYLMQTAFGLLLFYHIGFGLFGKTSPNFNVIIGVVFFMFQMLLANIWLRYYRYGIVEWLLRCATLGKYQKLMK